MAEGADRKFRFIALFVAPFLGVRYDTYSPNMILFFLGLTCTLLCNYEIARIIIPNFA
jgi:NADH:ubiquinone oxidoreductase subunit 2 (subunit N)